MLVILTGLQGTGKTTVGRMIAKRIKGVMLSTDQIRRELFPKKRTYSEEESRRTYQEMYARGRRMLADGENVILDATFLKEDYRKQAKDIARKTKTVWKVVEVTCDPKIIRNRFAQRKKRADPSEATYRVYLFTKKWYQKPSGRHITIDNSGAPEETAKQLGHYF